VDASDGEFYRKHADDLTRFATGLVGPDHAPDVVSEAVIGCMTSRQWKDVADKRAYLYRSVYNKAGEFYRSSQRRSSRERLIEPSEVLISPAIRPEVLAAVSRLSVRQRAVIYLYYWEDLHLAEVAKILHISDGSVRRHLARGKAHLKEALHADD
jgi:RNA polymerase sigma factor (sigma-70 family)